MISFDEFKKIELKVGTIVSAEKHPNANKLYILKVDLGEENPRQLVAGIAKFYSLEELENKKIIVVANLEPAKLRGIESNGMLLAAEDNEGNVVLLTTEKEMKSGSLVR
jgi:methionyl-tRNA synthetase